MSELVAMPDIWLYPLLFGAGLVAGLVDTMAGGGGLITVPVLMGMGFSPQVALGTNKFQASFGSGTATWHFARSGIVRGREAWTGILYTAAGAALGALVVQQIRPDFLRQIIPPLLIAIALYTLLSPRLGREETEPRMRSGPFHAFFGTALGFYDGFFGPGTGSFWVMAYMLGRGFDMKRGTAYTKVMNFTSNIASLALFMAGGCVYFGPGLVMAGGQFVGARIGAGLVLKRGTRLIRPVFIAAVLAISLKLLWQAFSG